MLHEPTIPIHTRAIKFCITNLSLTIHSFFTKKKENCRLDWARQSTTIYLSCIKSTCQPQPIDYCHVPYMTLDWHCSTLTASKNPNVSLIFCCYGPTFVKNWKLIKSFFRLVKFSFFVPKNHTCVQILWKMKLNILFSCPSVKSSWAQVKHIIHLSNATAQHKAVGSPEWQIQH